MPVVAAFARRPLTVRVPAGLNLSGVVTVFASDQLGDAN
jgi:hypothetical protein